MPPPPQLLCWNCTLKYSCAIYHRLMRCKGVLLARYGRLPDEPGGAFWYLGRRTEGQRVQAYVAYKPRVFYAAGTQHSFILGS